MTNAASNQTRCSKCGHDAFNGRYCEADDPAYQTRTVPCGCVCQFSVASNQELEPESEQVDTGICPMCKNEVPLDSMWSYNNVPNAFCQECVDSGRV